MSRSNDFLNFLAETVSTGPANVEKIAGEALDEFIAGTLIETRSKKVRGMAKKSLAMIAAMRRIAEIAQPITGRGIGYKLFTEGLIPGMGQEHRNHMQRVYRLLKEARERGMIPWSWIVDETRSLEKVATWDDPAEFAEELSRAYRREFWNDQPIRVEVWSEKGTVRGVLKPILNGYGVGFQVMHGFSGATTIHDVASGGDGRPLVVLYVGDWDPSGLCMSELDLPGRLQKYGGDHVSVKRIALTREDVTGLPSFPASDKNKDTRFKWFVRNYGTRCWELDAMDPNDLRARVESEIKVLIEPEAWRRCMKVNAAEQASLRTVLDKWRAAS